MGLSKTHLAIFLLLIKGVRALKNVFLVSLICGLLIGCGGGGGDGEVASVEEVNNATPTEEPVTEVDSGAENPAMTYRPTASAKKRLDSTISESIATEVMQIISYIFIDNEERFNITNQPVTIDSSLEVEGRFTDDCDRGGSFYFATDTPSQSYASGTGVYAAGDSNQIEFFECGDELLGEGFFLDGKTEFVVNAGVYDGFNSVVDGTDISFAFVHAGIYGYSGQYTYNHGNLRTRIASDELLIESTGLDRKDIYSLFDVEFGISAIESYTTKSVQSSGFYDVYTMTNTGDLILDARQTKALLTITVDDPLVINKRYSPAMLSGEMTITSESGTLRLFVGDTGTIWRLDSDDDSIVDADGFIDVSAYY